MKRVILIVAALVAAFAAGLEVGRVAGKPRQTKSRLNGNMR